MKTFLMWLALLPVVSSSAFAADVYDCSANSGRQFCINVRRTQSYLVSCNGDSCYRIWRQYINTLGRLTDHALDHFMPEDTFETHVGELAQLLADRICGTTQTADQNWINQLVVAENRALPVLKEIQEGAGIAVPSFCVKSSTK